MEKEEENDYVWALERFKRILMDDQYPSVILSDRELALMNAISIVFPNTSHLLCVWHIEKNVLSRCKKHFKEKNLWEEFISSWTNLIKSPDESTFVEAWNYFQVEYKENVQILDYLKTTWLPLKEKFVYAWTEKQLHFGNHVTSRAEGAHAILKKYLQTSTGDFRDMKEKICLAIENQYKETKTKLASEKIRIPHSFRIPLFEKLLNHVSVHALQKIFTQYELAKSEALFGKCKCHFQSSMGLPCAHKIRECKDGYLELVEIHPQWRIDNKSLEFDIGKSKTGDAQMHIFLNEFQEKYQEMPLSQK